MSRPVCQVAVCENPAACVIDVPLAGGYVARVRFCEQHALFQAKCAQGVHLDVTLQLARKRT